MCVYDQYDLLTQCEFNWSSRVALIDYNLVIGVTSKWIGHACVWFEINDRVDEEEKKSWHIDICVQMHMNEHILSQPHHIYTLYEKWIHETLD